MSERVQFYSTSGSGKDGVSGLDGASSGGKADMEQSSPKPSGNYSSAYTAMSYPVLAKCYVHLIKSPVYVPFNEYFKW